MPPVALAQHRAVNQNAPLNANQNVGNAQQGPPPGPVQFRSGNKSVFTKIAEKLGFQAPQQAQGAPNAPLKLTTPSKRNAFSNNFAFGRDLSMGSKAKRTDTQGHRAALISGMKFFANGRMNPSPRLDTNYTVANAKGEQLKGFSISADPNSSQLDTTRPVVLYFSGSGGSAENYGAEIGKNYALNKNVNFVAVNYRGYGDSDDVAPSETSIVKDGVTMINDLLAKGFSPDQIIVHGYSMGASVAAHVQSRVEEQGFQLRGVIYDRPMSSATGAASDYAKDMAKDILDVKPFKAFAGALGTSLAKVTVGSMSAHKTLNALKKASPNQAFTSPTLLTYDTGAFGARSDRMATDLNIPSTNLNANHFDQAAFVNTGMANIPNAFFV